MFVAIDNPSAMYPVWTPAAHKKYCILAFCHQKQSSFATQAQLTVTTSRLLSA
jgi:hypothetical protein